jgi:hypothetical protein
MVDFAELTRPGGYHYPEEVYLAAVGKPRKLARRILENEKLPPNERRALSAFLMGELLPPKRKRGQKRLAYLTTIENVNERLTLDAVLDYHHIMREVKKEYGTNHKVKFEAIEYISERDGINYDTLLNRINRPKKGADKPALQEVSYQVVEFHRWLHKTGRLSEYPPYISSVTAETAMLKAERELRREDEQSGKNDPPK